MIAYIGTVIEDFFRLLIDALIYYHYQLIPAPICESILAASISSLSLEQDAPLTATLHYLRDFLSYGGKNPNSSSLQDSRHNKPPVAPELQSKVKNLVLAQGEVLVQRILTGMMFSFPRECLQDASGVLLALFELMPEQVSAWVKNTITMLPPGSIKVDDGERLMNTIGQKIQNRDMRKVRVLLQGMHISRLYSSTLTMNKILPHPTVAETWHREKV